MAARARAPRHAEHAVAEVGSRVIDPPRLKKLGPGSTAPTGARELLGNRARGRGVGGATTGRVRWRAAPRRAWHEAPCALG